MLLARPVYVVRRLLDKSARALPGAWQPMLRARIRARHFPTGVTIEPTTQCNLKCLHCGRTYWKTRDQHRDMDFHLFQRLAAESARWGIRALTIQGLGEPLLHPQIFDFIAFAKQVGHYTRFNSNFTIMNEELAEKLVRSGHDEVMVSIESFLPELYADIRRKGTLDTVKRNIALLADARVRLGSATPKIRVNAVLMRSNIDQIELIVSEARALGATDVNFQGLNTDGIPEKSRLLDGTRMRDNALSTLQEEEIAAIAERIRALDTPEFRVSMWWDISGRRKKEVPKDAIRVCTDIWELPYVDSGGEVTPCCLIPDGSILSMGNMKDKSFGEIWHGESFNELRKQHLNGTPPKICVDCQARSWVFDPDTGDFFNERDERYSNYFVRGSGQN